MRKLFLAAAACALLPAVALAQPENWELVRKKTEAKLAEIAASTRGIVGVAAVDLTSGERFGLNENLVFPQGSAIKVPILLELYRQAAEGKLKLSDRLRVEKRQQVGGSGIIGQFSDGTSELSLRDLAVLMIVLSDNTATNMLIERVGLDSVNRTLASLGLERTRLQRKMMDEAAKGRGEENLSTPAEAAHLMEILFKCEGLERASCDDMLSILAIEKPGQIRRGVPENVPVAFKPGSIPGVTVEWAIVQLKERPYVLVVMENFGLEDEGAQAMEKISRLLYDYFWRRSHSTRYGTYVDPALIH